jgi:lysozyme family protein
VTAFEQFWAFLQRPDIEGGARVSNDPNDPGGLTKWGISQREYPHEDIRAMTEDRAKLLFRRDYWDVCRCDELPAAVALALADAAFNQGPGTAIKMLQHALGVMADSVVGQVTLRAAHAADANRLNEFFSQRLLRYADSHPLDDRHGWFLRVLKLKDELQRTA